ncbi:hypothetical protein, partial [Bradyrhizobium macuxiense]|uniref:hypothetical protein n=1 Tax=Bradyrhizobium macuxiense TaxID=1755647 RepID=UPI001AECD95A
MIQIKHQAAALSHEGGGLRGLPLPIPFSGPQAYGTGGGTRLPASLVRRIAVAATRIGLRADAPAAKQRISRCFKRKGPGQLRADRGHT